MKGKIFTIAAIVVFSFFSYSLRAQAVKSSSSVPELSASPGKREESPVNANDLRIEYKSVQNPPCLNGFAGYDIHVIGRQITTTTYYDKDVRSGKSGSLSDLEYRSVGYGLVPDRDVLCI